MSYVRVFSCFFIHDFTLNSYDFFINTFYPTFVDVVCTKALPSKKLKYVEMFTTAQDCQGEVGPSLSFELARRSFCCI